MPTFDLTHLLTLLGGAALAAVGFLIKRQITGAREQERVSRYASLTDIASKMRASGISPGDIAAVEGFMRGKLREEVLVLADAPATDTAEEPDGYWTQYAMNQRAGAALATASARLKQVLVELEHYVGDGLWSVQEAWERFKDAQADLAGSEFEGGSIVPLIKASEAEALTEQRIAWATAQLEERKARG